MSLHIQFPEIILLQKLMKSHKREVYLVGGFLRDHYLGRSSVDLDFTVNRGAIKLAKMFADKIQGAFVLLDEENDCARVVKKRDGVIVTFDFAVFRAPTLKEDLAKRDFTINTLSLDVTKIDSGSKWIKSVKAIRSFKKDVEDKSIRMLSPQSFDDDPLRLMRAFTLMANFGFSIEKKTVACIKEKVDLVQSVSMERMRDEFFKVLQSPRAFKTLKAMHRAGLLMKVVPQLHVMVGVEQGGFHHLDVWKHSLEVVNQFEKLVKSFKKNDDIMNYLNESIAGERTRLALTKFGCLLHDIGKPDTKRMIDGRFRFHRHERVGKGITKIIGKQLKLSTKERRKLEMMVLHHLRPGFISNNETISKRMAYRYFRDTEDEAVSIALLAIADQRSALGPLTSDHDITHHQDICFELIDQYFREEEKEVKAPALINGRDVMKVLSIKPSEIVGDILEKVIEAQSLGKLKTKAQALAMVEKIYSRVKS